jgi:hypothetical protein
MINENLKSRIELYKSLFRGRDDVFAIHWEKGGKMDICPHINMIHELLDDVNGIILAQDKNIKIH